MYIYLFFIILIVNYIPPFIVHRIHRDVSRSLDLSPSMTERMGLFAIIMFGEVVLGVVNGVSHLNKNLHLQDWINFGLAVLIVFSLWWLFFTVCSDRKCKRGFVNSSLMQIVYIPTLMSLGLIGAGFSSLFEYYGTTDEHFIWFFKVFKFSLGIFFLGTAGIMLFLKYPDSYAHLTKFTQWILLPVSALFFVLALNDLYVSLFVYLMINLGVILILILILNFKWYNYYLKQVGADSKKDTG